MKEIYAVIDYLKYKEKKKLLGMLEHLSKEVGSLPRLENDAIQLMF